MAWPKRTNWLAWIAGIVLAIVVLIVGIAMLSKSADSMGRQVGDSMNQAAAE